ncbi:MAG: 16S rRNA (uracil(1498)-N(3))-methyltransferase [Candidatus Aminicenantes bacterium]|nr:16S rRNA (uracil(1498)-N(3))-methyltransferase [Candidatus Aminicenantes bacterium]
MTSKLFFIDKNRISGRNITLAGPEHHHLSRVVRSKQGDVIWLFDGNGARYRARIEEIGTDMTKLSLLENSGQVEFRSRIILGQALLKAKAMDLVVQKSTELGLFMLVSIITARSVVKVEDRSEKKVERWTKITREASKQSKSGLVPRIQSPQPLNAFLKSHEAAVKIFLNENGGRPLLDIVLMTAGAPASDVAVLVGPEGGWTNEEEKMIAAHGYESASLGQAILRAETAAICALSIVSHFWNL